MQPRNWWTILTTGRIPLVGGKKAETSDDVGRFKLKPLDKRILHRLVRDKGRCFVQEDLSEAFPDGRGGFIKMPLRLR